jgi:hypothetical protein
MLKFALPAAALLVCVPLSAQEDHFTSSPQGFEGVEGNMSIDLIGKEPLLRFQQVDAFTYGAKTNRNRIGFRRDGLLPTNPAYGARIVELEVAVGEGSLGSMSTSFTGNYNSGTHQVVFTQKQVNFPDWSAAPALPPQAESQWLILFTDVVGWGYPGRTASGTDFVWEVRVWNSSKAGQGYPMDADTAIPASLTNSGATVGSSSCIATGQVSSPSYSISMSNYGTSFDLLMNVVRCQAGQTAFSLLGATQLTTNLGFCAPLQLVPVLSVNMGPTDPTGRAEANFLGLNHNAALIGQNIYGQAVAFDTTLGLVLSQGRQLTVPGDPPAGTQVKHMWALDPNAASATSGIVDGGIILHTNHP